MCTSHDTGSFQACSPPSPGALVPKRGPMDRVIGLVTSPPRACSRYYAIAKATRDGNAASLRWARR